MDDLKTSRSLDIGLDILISSFKSEKKLSTFESVKDHVIASIKPLEATYLCEK